MLMVAKCEFCGETLPAEQRTCPKCGGVVKDVDWKKLRLLILLIVLIMMLWGFVWRFLAT